MKAYSLQDGGLDTVEANEKLGFGADLRNYGVGAQILGDLGIHRLRLLTNNPRKIAGLGGYGLEVVSRIPLIINPGDHNANYLATKRDKLGHLFNENSSNDVVTLAWDCGEDLIAKLPDLLNRAEMLASELNLSLQPEQTPRLLALWERPQFVWSVQPFFLSSNKEAKSLSSRLSCNEGWRRCSAFAVFKKPSLFVSVQDAKVLRNCSIAELSPEIVQTPCEHHRDGAELHER